MRPVNAFTILFMSLTLWTGLAHAQTSDLVSPSWLASTPAGNQTGIKIIDLRSHQQYLNGHIPNAINLPMSSLTRTKNKIKWLVATPKQFKFSVEKLGIRNDDTVVLYSDWAFLDAMRAYWIFDFFGHKNIKVLDGGIQNWSKHHERVQWHKPTFNTSNYVIHLRHSILATQFNTFMATKSDDFMIIDTRDHDQFEGKISLTHKKGHIPTAINFPWFELINNRNKEDGYQKLSQNTVLQNTEKLNALLTKIPNNKNIIVYCNGGAESSVLYFALKQRGAKVSLYDGSWADWSQSNMPVEVNK